MSIHGCLNGIRLRVYVDQRKAIPLIEDDGSLSAAFGTEALDTVQGLTDSIGHLSQLLILQQFNFEQRIRSQGRYPSIFFDFVVICILCIYK